MGADADHHEPRLAILGGTIVVARRRTLGKIGVPRERVAQIVDLNVLRRGNLLVGAVADEDRLAAPHDSDRLARLDMGDIDLGARQRQRRCVGIYLVEQRPDGGHRADGGKAARCDQDDVAPRRLVVWLERRIEGGLVGCHGAKTSCAIAKTTSATVACEEAKLPPPAPRPCSEYSPSSCMPPHCRSWLVRRQAFLGLVSYIQVQTLSSLPALGKLAHREYCQKSKT